MAGFDPAIQTHAFRAWMLGSRPGMMVRVTNNKSRYQDRGLSGAPQTLARFVLFLVQPNFRA
jgi:hypothetical protein